MIEIHNQEDAKNNKNKDYSIFIPPICIGLFILLIYICFLICCVNHANTDQNDVIEIVEDTINPLSCGNTDFTVRIVLYKKYSNDVKDTTYYYSIQVPDEFNDSKSRQRIKTLSNDILIEYQRKYRLLYLEEDEN